ncbi:MAG: cation:proton antiporter, partial [Eubacteriales bacterium]
ELMEKSEALGYSFLIPVFFVSIGLKAKVESVSGGLMFIVILSIIAILTKVIGCGAGAKLSGFGWKKSLVIGTGMVSRGEIALIIASIGLNAKLIDNSLFTALVIMILVSTIVTPPMLKAVIHLSDRKVKHVS